jgi:hypothetical protein
VEGGRGGANKTTEKLWAAPKYSLFGATDCPSNLVVVLSFSARGAANAFQLSLCCSWGGGANVWGTEKDDKFTTPNHWDGMLEVVGVTGVVHLGQIQSGLRSAIRIVQVLIILRGRQIIWILVK